MRRDRLMSGLPMVPLPCLPRKGEGIGLRWRRGLLFAVAACLSACATPEPVVVTRPVAMPVAQPCKVAAPEEPRWPMESLGRGAEMFASVRAALGEIEARRAYEAELEAAVRACR